MSALIKRHPGILRAPTEPEMDRVVSDSAPMQGDGPASGGFYTSKNVTGMSGQEAVSMALGELVQRRLCDVQWEVRDSAIEFIASLLDAKHGQLWVMGSYFKTFDINSLTLIMYSSQYQN